MATDRPSGQSRERARIWNYLNRRNMCSTCGTSRLPKPLTTHRHIWKFSWISTHRQLQRVKLIKRMTGTRSRGRKESIRRRRRRRRKQQLSKAQSEQFELLMNSVRISVLKRRTLCFINFKAMSKEKQTTINRKSLIEQIFHNFSGIYHNTDLLGNWV